MPNAQEYLIAVDRALNMRPDAAGSGDYRFTFSLDDDRWLNPQGTVRRCMARTQSAAAVAKAGRVGLQNPPNTNIIIDDIMVLIRAGSAIGAEIIQRRADLAASRTPGFTLDFRWAEGQTALAVLSSGEAVSDPAIATGNSMGFITLGTTTPSDWLPFPGIVLPPDTSIFFLSNTENELLDSTWSWRETLLSRYDRR